MTEDEKTSSPKTSKTLKTSKTSNSPKTSKKPTKNGNKKERNLENEKRTIFVGNLPKDCKKEVTLLKYIKLYVIYFLNSNFLSVC